jgi:hypothetical protein
MKPLECAKVRWSCDPAVINTPQPRRTQATRWDAIEIAEERALERAVRSIEALYSRYWEEM